ncbi:EAL domain-containing protein [Celeribacter halophilus]|uniref:EAL domain, c-di-GMP-specific phosphodiesterase class I (Or its enzymatically inactive variant) n=1 Tax=Celeribacter halophilus TaxID=576117 RepID=A0A1I3UT14_9RHOB|nr:EAL domain-containing protein [Celeribacter halophilus]PZX10001.1 EAL domain-containing protein (putative c-di-GMP-specific phosphodiesterase class I) [Celeribacter halophilus]SFJ86110.1 EAL domain, c-di-GMP-specific phosphodiesterase class I (or its enzymatically inactive variant) [Celeribacter halophilus]
MHDSFYDNNNLESPLSVAIAARDRHTMDMVKEALDKKHVMLAYQPIVHTLRPDRPAFYEALIRVLDQNGRVIPAREFIEVAETTETGRILDCLSLELGLQALHEHPDLRLAINMSARSIGYPRWKQTLTEGLAKGPTIAERLILEITESSAMVMPDLVSVFMSDLQSMGISFALDDFGAGYTAFRYLKDFYFDIVKIDGGFIRGVASNPDNQVLTQALVSVAKHFDMYTVAEFVENTADAEYLTEIGVDCMQGHYFGAATIDPVWRRPETKHKAG